MYFLEFQYLPPMRKCDVYPWKIRDLDKVYWMFAGVAQSYIYTVFAPEHILCKFRPKILLHIYFSGKVV